MAKQRMSRKKLIELVREIQNAQDRGTDYSELQRDLIANVPYPRVAELLLGDYSAEHIVDFSIGWTENQCALSKPELVDLVKKIQLGQGTSSEQALWLAKFKQNCKHPAKSNLIYYPQKYFKGRKSPTAEEIAQKALEG